MSTTTPYTKTIY